MYNDPWSSYDYDLQSSKILQGNDPWSSNDDDPLSPKNPKFYDPWSFHNSDLRSPKILQVIDPWSSKDDDPWSSEILSFMILNHSSVRISDPLNLADKEDSQPKKILTTLDQLKQRNKSWNTKSGSSNKTRKWRPPGSIYPFYYYLLNVLIRKSKLTLIS